MPRRFKRIALALAVALAAAPALADDLTGADEILCTAVQATICLPDGECESGPPWNWNVPQFIEIDLDDKVLQTTKASGENRSTPIKTLVREKGLIFLQGLEAGRAFSFVITEDGGFLTAAVAREEVAVSLFGACTPMP